MTEQLRTSDKSWTSPLFRIWLPTILLTVLITIILYVYSVEPPPPKTLVIATGSKAGAYYKIALQYKAILHKQGIDLEILNTAGSIDNLGKLANSSSGVDLAFIQGGVTSSSDRKQKTSHLRSLGSLYSEVMWVFYRGAQPLQRLTQLKGKRIGVGPMGSGTRPVTLEVLRKNGITAKNTSLRKLSSIETQKQLQAGALDAAFFITSPQAKYVQALLKDPNCHLMNFGRHLGYIHMFPYLSSVTLGQGQLDMMRNQPTQTIKVLAPAATLVVRKDFPSSLVYLLMQTLNQTHSKGNLIDLPGKFPSKQYVSFPMYPQAKQYLRYGPSWLQRNLPFWWATLIHRFSILGFSLLTLLYPLWKTVPFFYTWRARSRIYRWYQILRVIDDELSSETTREEMEVFLSQLDQLEQETQGIRVPMWHMAELYTLRIHINYLRMQIGKMA